MTESEKLIRLFKSHCDSEMVKQFEKAVTEVFNKLNQKNMWTKEKPELTKECTLLTLQIDRDNYKETQSFEVLLEYGEEENTTRWAVFQNGDEWGDYEDLEADYYMLIDFPVLSLVEKGGKLT